MAWTLYISARKKSCCWWSDPERPSKRSAGEWYAKRAEVWSPGHAARVLSWLERDLFPFL
ncbi:phage integrase central domain-containing protein [Acidicapsa ligni]|uniref:phage integrase central domain-containing protein n=1 Tax=Acidicapsa ligni TaxID=542300 RepID=UPI0037BF65C2